ncbi:response regulator [Cloacibacterium sp. TD35]|uniref:response regulator n=1 Tax=Cloacibacterium sp. TD35 TaxID=2976818 RepID=UPI00237D3D5B|nr:response regulator [Cloacibacterium sp. TD35]WDT68530.1 response regulator [Cloacibacterium sp. TD35]
MFSKILIAEDHEIRNLGVIKTLEELQIKNYEFVSYCDDAITKLKTAISEENPYDLLITDLSFDGDSRVQKLTSGQELITEVRQLLPDIKIIAFSIEKKPSIIDELFKKHHINGFVSKGRNDAKELKNAIKKVYEDKIVIPQEIINSIRNNSFEFTNYDVHLVELLAKGWRQQEIEDHFKSNHIKPDSRSSIEKRLSELRENLDAKNNIEMVVICKDLGII